MKRRIRSKSRSKSRSKLVKSLNKLVRYYVITADKYEYIIKEAESQKELADFLQVSQKQISEAIKTDSKVKFYYKVIARNY